MRTLLCLLSDQHVPNLLSVHHFQPDRLVLIESRQMQQRKVGDHFLQALALGGQDYGGDRHDRQPLDHEDSLLAVRKALQAAFGRHPSDEWIVNVTGGTKPMSIETYQIFTALGGTLVYINLSEPDRIQWMDGSKVETCGHRLSIAEFLAGYGFSSRKPPAEVAEGEARASSWWDLARALAAEASPGELLVFESDKQRQKARDKGLTLEPGHLRSPIVDSPAIRSRLAEAFGMAESSGGLAGKLDKYQVNFLLGQWLEVFVWGLLERNQGALGIWDVRLGLEPASPDGKVANDFDVAFMRRYALWVVECKTGAQEHDPQFDIQYKVEAIARQFRALRVQTVLATTSDNVLDENGKVKESHRNRAEAYGCKIVTRDQVRQLAASDDPVALLKTMMGR